MGVTSSVSSQPHLWMCMTFGDIQWLRGHNFALFLTTTYLHVDIFNPERGQEWHFLDHLPPLLVHVVIGRPLSDLFFATSSNFDFFYATLYEHLWAYDKG